MTIRLPSSFLLKPSRVGVMTTTVFFALILIGTVIVYHWARAAYEAELHEDLENLVAAASSLVDGDTHQRLVASGQEDGDEYRTSIAPLVKMKAMLPEVRFLYTLALVDDSVRFVLDATPAGDADGDGVEDHSNLLDTYDDAPETAVAALHTERVMSTAEFYEDKWGRFLSGYAPIYDSAHKMVGVVAIDMTFENYQVMMADFRGLLFVLLGIAFVISIVAGYMVYKLLTMVIAAEKRIEAEALETLKTKTEFLSVVTHELRTPLTVIKESIEIVEEGDAGEVNEEQKKFLVIAKRNLQRLARLVNNVLDYQKLDAQRTELHREAVDVHELATEVCRSYGLVAAEKGVRITPEIADGCPRIMLDRDRIIQVLSNLLDNAIKYTPRNKGIRLRVGCDGSDVKVEVIDEGAGMKQDELSKLFTVFTQLSNAKEGRVRGTGLGLSIAKKIVELHGGAVGVHSAPGAGSTFYFTVPYHPR